MKIDIDCLCPYSIIIFITDRKTTMNKRTIQELKDEGYTVYSESQAREIIVEHFVRHKFDDYADMFELESDVYDMSLEEIENYLYDDMIVFEWQEVQQP